MAKHAVNLTSFLLQIMVMAIAAPVSAHHSFAGYDMTKTYTASATIKEFRWGAPHSASVFVIKGPEGNAQEMTIASASPSMLVKQGFMPKDFHVGDKVQIAWHPTRSGHVGGILASIKLPDGRTFNDVESAQISAHENAERGDRLRAQRR